MDEKKYKCNLWGDFDEKYIIPAHCMDDNFDLLLSKADTLSHPIGITSASLKLKYFDNFEVIINKPAVILIVHHIDPYKPDEKFVAKAYNEKFDPEKGLAICLLKYYGSSYPDLKRMIKNAKVQETKKKVKKNKKKAGK